MRAIPRTAVLLPAVLIVLSACATKGWVRENMDKRETEISQRVDTVDQRSAGGPAGGVVGQRVGTVEGKVTQESQRVDERGIPRQHARDHRHRDERGGPRSQGSLARGDGQG